MNYFFDADNYLARNDAGYLMRTETPEWSFLIVTKHLQENFKAIIDKLALVAGIDLSTRLVSRQTPLQDDYFSIEDTYRVNYDDVKAIAELAARERVNC